MSELKNLKDKVVKAIEDLATLEVATFTGNIDLSDVVKDEKLEKNTFAKIRSSLLDGNLVGYTRFEIEGDAINYTNSDLGEEKAFLLEAHNSLVKGAQQSRKNFFEFVLKVIGINTD